MPSLRKSRRRRRKAIVNKEVKVAKKAKPRALNVPYQNPPCDTELRDFEYQSLPHESLDYRLCDFDALDQSTSLCIGLYDDFIDEPHSYFWRWLGLTMNIMIFFMCCLFALSLFLYYDEYHDPDCEE